MNNDCIEKTEGYHPTGLQIRLIKRTYVFPWSQFLFAEGDADEIRIAFSTHDIVVSGRNLNDLLRDISAQRISLMKESVRAELFTAFPEPQITKIFVKKAE